MYRMKKVSSRDLDIRTSEPVGEAGEESLAAINRRGTLAAELQVISSMPVRSQLPELSELWRCFPSVATDSGRFLEEDR